MGWNETIQSDEFKALSQPTTPVHSRQGVVEAVERFAWAAGVYEDEQMLADINTIRAALADQSGDLTDMVSRPSLEMVSIPRGPAITDPEAFDDCLACDIPSLEPIQLSGNTGELPATAELSKNLGQLKSLEPPASDVAGWRLIESAPKDGTRVIGFTKFGVEIVKWHEWDGSPYAPRTGWIGVEQDSTCYPESYLRAKATYQPTHWMPLPAPPHPASKEVGADELQGLIVTHEIAAERMAARIAELERENARLLNAFDGIVDQPASHGEGGA